MWFKRDVKYNLSNMINRIETDLNNKTSGRETGFVKEPSLGRETGFAPKTNEVAAEIKNIFET